MALSYLQYGKRSKRERERGREQRMNSTQTILNREEEEEGGERREDKKEG